MSLTESEIESLHFEGWTWVVDLIQEKDAVIDRLKGQIDARDSVISKLSGTAAEWRPLLTRAANVLGSVGKYTCTDYAKVAKELREAAK